MKSSARPGWLHRTGTALGRALKRFLLGNSSHEYMKQFSGSDEYWDEAIAAQRGWPMSRDTTPGTPAHGADKVQPK